MARIEGVYKRFLKTIPQKNITTLSPKVSQEIDLAISEVFSKKKAAARREQLRAEFLLREHYWNTLEKIKE